MAPSQPSTSSSAKKRKRAVVEAEDAAIKASGVKFRRSELPASELGPILVKYPALEPSSSTAFSCYSVPGSETKPRKLDPKGSTNEEYVVGDYKGGANIVAAETDDVEYVTEPTETRLLHEQSGCKYLVGIYNKRTKTVVFRHAPHHILTQTVKAHKSINAKTAVPKLYKEAKTALGESFGTKKAKAAIRTEERNKIDVGAVNDVMTFLQKGIEHRTNNLPTAEQAKEAFDESRLIPPINQDAESPEDVYPLSSIIPDVEWHSISVSALSAPGLTNVDRFKTLPNARSEWVKDHVVRFFSSDKQPKKKDLKILYYIATLFAFKRAVGDRNVQKDFLHRKLEGVPPVIIDALLERFTELPRGSSTEYKPTSKKQTLLQAYLFALCLKLDSYAVDTNVIAKDLSTPEPTIKLLFKSLGCTIKALTEAQRLKLGIADSAAPIKRAVLSCPVTLPEPRTRRKNARK